MRMAQYQVSKLYCIERTMPDASWSLVLTSDGEVKGYTDHLEAEERAEELNRRAKGAAAYRVIVVDAGPVAIRPMTWLLGVI